jgi:hypothetical protein
MGELTGAVETTVWVSPGATAYSCLCEHCLERARVEGRSLFDAMHEASVRGSIASASDVAFARCPVGHQIVIRRVERPPSLPRRDQEQLQLA